MNDAEYLFHADAQEKKIIGRSSYHKARPGKRVVLPSDRLTEREIKEMSGEVKSYNLKNPMKWAEYKEMPDDLKKEYLNRLRDLYNASNNAIGAMMGVSDTTIKKETVRLGVRSLTKNDRNKPEWENFIKYCTPERKASERTENARETHGERTGNAALNCGHTFTAEEISDQSEKPAEETTYMIHHPAFDSTAPVAAHEEKPVDMVNHPPHYCAGGVECIDAIAAATAKLTGMEAVCTAQVIKYVWRWKLKNGVEDLEKARFYLDRLIQEAGA